MKIFDEQFITIEYLNVSENEHVSCISFES